MIDKVFRNPVGERFGWSSNDRGAKFGQYDDGDYVEWADYENERERNVEAVKVFEYLLADLREDSSVTEHQWATRIEEAIARLRGENDGKA